MRPNPALGWLLLAGVAMAADYRVPLMAKPPTIDGKIEPAEWAASAGFDGFAFNNTLDRRRIRAWVGATKTHLYFAIQSQLPDEGQLVAEVNKDTVKLVFDDSIEVWIDPTPGSEHGQAFQLLANAALRPTQGGMSLSNAAGRTAYKHHGRGNVAENPAWQGDWKVANGFHGGWWHCEIEVPIGDLAPGRTADQNAWGINLCRNWKNPWAFSSTGGGGYAPSGRFTFAPDALAIAHESRSDAFVGDIHHALVLRNPTAAPITVKTALSLKRDVMPELINSEILTLAPGEKKEVAIKAKDDATRKFELALSVASADGKTVYYQRSIAWQKGEPWRWTTKKKEVLPIDFQFAYYPYRNEMRVLADVSNLPQDAKLETLTCSIRPKGRRAVKTVTFDAFKDGRQELEFALPRLDGQYEIAVTAHGQNVPKGELVKAFERTVYEWERKGLGISTKVYPPFTPIQVEGKKVCTVLREHTMNDFGLWDQVVAAGKPLLAAPMRLALELGGKPAELQAQPLRFDMKVARKAAAHTSIESSPFRAEVGSVWDYDGLMRVTLVLLGTGPVEVNSLRLEIPLKDEMAPMIHAMGDGIRNTVYSRVPEGEGVVWDSSKVQVNDLPKGFCSYIYVGSPVRGLSWFCENDKGWAWDQNKPNLDLVRKGDQLILRIHFVNKPTALKAGKITFGLQAAPVKPRIGNWRYAWHREKYTLLGTDINWLALGDCGSVYPAGKDMLLWEMIKRGNKEKLSDEEVNKVIEHGKKYFEPYGEEKVKSYIAHVRHNLRSRYGAKMVFYYNRASYQLADEFQTFQDEWGLTDFRTVGKGNGIWEIKIVPTDSYIDHALWWYGKSFDAGGNQGVYWDNYFFVGSYNTMATGAYKEPDGSVMPSNGLWGLRELVKRTFVYMNERGMRPITMPHMTSTNILPLYSFATVQYDWEWKYSEGDVQYRFPREYILLVSTGELAGVWPVLLGDHGKLADDPWTQRTFAAVCLVHELDGWGRQDVWEPLFKHVHRLVETPGVEVYRYWDDRPQPVVADSPDLPTIVYSLKGKEAVFAVTSYSEKDLKTAITMDPKALGFEGAYRVVDAETGNEEPVQSSKLSLTIKKHDVREFRVIR
jgi:hypothetical protein